MMIYNLMHLQCVRIRPSTDEGHAAVAKYGNFFWRRQATLGGNTMLIPIVDGIPLIDKFIFVPTGDLIDGETTVGYGRGGHNES